MGPGFCPEFGCRALPAQCIWQGSGFAADQTNAMLATSNGGDKSSRKRKPLHLLGITAYAEEFSICGREMKCFFIWLSRDYFPCLQRFFGNSMRGGIITLGVHFMPLKRWTPVGHGGVFAVFMPPQNSPCVGRISPRRVHTPLQPRTAHTAAHRAKQGAFSPPETSAGSIGSTA